MQYSAKHFNGVLGCIEPHSPLAFGDVNRRRFNDPAAFRHKAACLEHGLGIRLVPRCSPYHKKLSNALPCLVLDLLAVYIRLTDVVDATVGGDLILA
ncbi:hypothetical protein Rcae01_02449 [Novipirellula caenicola]|uniref:Uncharacterized protein n=1 Tax=Novipirellula caenicola TaxID=1536901 RepID=A0ABP9VQU9_9BACT